MAKRKAVKKSKRVAKGIAFIIKALAQAKQDARLCSVGEERLKWWRRNRYKFKSVRAALLTWTANQVDAWFDYAGVDRTVHWHIDRWWDDLDSMFGTGEGDLSWEQKKLFEKLLNSRPSTVEIMLDGISEFELSGELSIVL